MIAEGRRLEIPDGSKRLSRWATRVIDGTVEGAELVAPRLDREALELLPGWYEEWVISERERMRRRLLHAMESLVRQPIIRRAFADTVEVAMSAVSVEPLRESAQRVLIGSHRAEGNFVWARRVYVSYRRLIAEEWGISPRDELAEILRMFIRVAGQRRRIDAPVLCNSGRRTCSTEARFLTVLSSHRRAKLVVTYW
jgi:DNA-binding SARP family transcriptional activator